VVKARSPRSKKIIVSWHGRQDAEFAFGDAEIESAVMFALRYAINLKLPVYLNYLGNEMMFDGRLLSELPKRIPMWQQNLPLKPKKKIVVRRKK
jgi:hypothetical protein